MGKEVKLAQEMRRLLMPYVSIPYMGKENLITDELFLILLAKELFQFPIWVRKTDDDGDGIYDDVFQFPIWVRKIF